MNKEELKKEFYKIIDNNIHREGIKDLLDALEEDGFFECPGSTKYHGSYEGGLLEHSINVYYSLLDELTFIFGKGWNCRYSLETVTIVSLFHDLCKIGRYNKSIRNVKNKETGAWETIPCYEYNNDSFQMGHASHSVYYIMRFMTLSPEEAQAIYWHMGAFDISQYSTVGNLSEAFSSNTLAFALHRSDMFATHICENTRFKPISI